MSLKTRIAEHEWREAVGRCICCWNWCARCRQCRCQVTTRYRRNGAGGCSVEPKGGETP